MAKDVLKPRLFGGAAGRAFSRRVLDTITCVFKGVTQTRRHTQRGGSRMITLVDIRMRWLQVKE
jgi:hypothetical protein